MEEAVTFKVESKLRGNDDSRPAKYIQHRLGFCFWSWTDRTEFLGDRYRACSSRNCHQKKTKSNLALVADGIKEVNVNRDADANVRITPTEYRKK